MRHGCSSLQRGNQELNQENLEKQGITGNQETIENQETMEIQENPDLSNGRVLARLEREWPLGCIPLTHWV